MIVLPLPSTKDDDQHLARICAQPDFARLSAKWSGAYGNYRKKKGNPWKIDKTEFSARVGALLGALYDSQGQSQRISTIRGTSLASCPMCGSTSTGTLDHYLPRETFPEFAVMAANLVPACSHCNSGKKRRTFKGVHEDERFLHPYFDTVAASPIWYVKVVPPYAAATFQACALPTLGRSRTKTVTFHLQNVLGPQFFRFLETRWAKLPAIARINLKNTSVVTSADLADFIQLKIKETSVAYGPNSWEAALYRGLERDGAVRTYLLQTI